jgi:hypothetical protein
MGRLTEAYGFCNVNPNQFTPLWIKHHITTLNPKPELYVIRKQILRLKTKNTINEKN